MRKSRKLLLSLSYTKIDLMLRSNPLSSQSGSSLVESTISVLLFCLIALGVIESAHWLIVRQALNTALLDTARIAVTQHAHPRVIETAFAQQLDRLTTFNFRPKQRYWSINYKTLQPTTNAVQHSYQALQFLQGNQSIFDQNTLALHLTYGHKPLTPLIRTVIQHSSAWLYSQHTALSQLGLVPIVTEIRLAMQSDQYQNQTGTIAPQSFEDPTIRSNTIKTNLSSLLWSNSNASGLLPWQPTRPNNPIPDQPLCDADQCCGPIY